MVKGSESHSWWDMGLILGNVQRLSIAGYLEIPLDKTLNYRRLDMRSTEIVEQRIKPLHTNLNSTELRMNAEVKYDV